MSPSWMLLQFEAVIAWMFSNPEVGWVIVILYLVVELRTKKGALYKVNKNVDNLVVVVRALARVNDDIDTSRVDEFLSDKRIGEPLDFLANFDYTDFDVNDDSSEEERLEQIIRRRDD